MKDKPTQDEIARFHRWFAIDCNNSTWRLASVSERSPSDNREMLFRAYAAAFHWSQVGTPLNEARADLTLAHTHALLGQGEPAMTYALRAKEFFTHNECEDWDR